MKFVLVAASCMALAIGASAINNFTNVALGDKWLPWQLNTPAFPKWEILSRIYWAPEGTNTSDVADHSYCLSANVVTEGAQVTLMPCGAGYDLLVLDSNWHISFVGAAGHCLEVFNGTQALGDGVSGNTTSAGNVTEEGEGAHGVLGNGWTLELKTCQPNNPNQFFGQRVPEGWDYETGTRWQFPWKPSKWEKGTSDLCIDVVDGAKSLIQLWTCQDAQETSYNQRFGWQQLLKIEYPAAPVDMPTKTVIHQIQLE